MEKLPDGFQVFLLGYQRTSKFFDGHPKVPEPESLYIPAVIGGHFNQPCLFMFCVCKFRPFLHVFAEGILNGILGVLLTAKYHNADLVQHPAVLFYCRFQVHIFPSPFLLCIHLSQYFGPRRIPVTIRRAGKTGWQQTSSSPGILRLDAVILMTRTGDAKGDLFRIFFQTYRFFVKEMEAP